MKTERISDNLVHKISWFNLLTFQSKPYFVTFKQSEWIFKDLTKAFHIAKPNQTVGNRQQLQQTFKHFGFEYTHRECALDLRLARPWPNRLWLMIFQTFWEFECETFAEEKSVSCTATVREESRLPSITILTGTVTWKIDLIMNNQI